MSSMEKTEFDSIAGSIFYGKVDENLVIPFPAFSEDQREMAFAMTDAIDKFAKDSIDGEKFDTNSEIPEDVLKGLAELGLFGLAVDENYGGLSLDYTLYARVFQQLAGYDGSTATVLGAHQSIGYRALVNEGSKEQKDKWLSDLASGKRLAAFCLTEPSSGSDAYSIKTKAVENEDGTFTINGQKLWITNGGKADFYTVFVKQIIKLMTVKLLRKLVVLL